MPLKPALCAADGGSPRAVGSSFLPSEVALFGENGPCSVNPAGDGTIPVVPILAPAV